MSARRFTMESMIGLPIASARRRAQAETDRAATASAAEAMVGALEAHDEARRPALARAGINALAYYIARTEGPVEAATALAAPQGRICPGINTDTARDRAETAWGRRS